MPPLVPTSSAGPSVPAQRSSSSTSLGIGQAKKEAPMQRLGNYRLGREIGRGSFATVHKAYRSKTQEVVAIKAVSRQKLTAKLLENLESEINILKAINHRNIVGLEDCFKTDTHIYLVMEYCTGSDLSFYIKNRGKLPSLDFVPRPGMFPGLGSHPVDDSGKMYWPHPATGGLDERVTRCLLGQLAQALKFLRSQDLIHRDIKPQNLLMQPPTAAEIAEGHPLGIPVLKVADFGFARILPAAAMAETLCGSPLYMAPEILRYEKYDAKADLWSVGAVLFEMCIGRPPFRANNHVELLRRIEKGNDRIKFPDESQPDPDSKEPPTPIIPPGADIKALIRSLLKRKPAERLGFPDFFQSGVWDGFLSESVSSEGESSLSPDVMSVEGSEAFAASASERLRRSRDMRRSREREAEWKLKEAVEKERNRFGGPAEQEGERGRSGREREMPTGQWGGHHVRQPHTADPALNPTPAPAPLPIATPALPPSHPQTSTLAYAPSSSTARRPSLTSAPIERPRESTPDAISSPFPDPIPPLRRPSHPLPPVTRRSEPKYYVSDPAPNPEPQPPAPPPLRHAPVSPSIANARKLSLLTGTGPTSGPDPTPPPPAPAYPRARVSEGSPLASTPPITRNSADVYRDDSALEGSDSVVGREYVMVEKNTVEVNALADALDQASRTNQALIRRPSTRTSVVSRPVSAFKPSISTQTQTSERAPSHNPTSYSPPFAMSTTPPFAMSGLPPGQVRRPSLTSGLSPTAGIGGPSSLLRTPSSVPQMTVFPPAAIAGYSPDSLSHGHGRYGASPSSLQGGALARALAHTAVRIIGQGANTAATAIARATAKRRPTIHRTGEMDEEEEELLRAVEDVARKAFALFELGDARLAVWNSLVRRDTSAAGMMKESSANNSPFANDMLPSRRKSSSSSTHSELIVLRQQELMAGEACVLYCKALGFLVKGTNMIQLYWEISGGDGGKAGVELNEMVQWLRARFNECYEKADWAKARCAEELPFIEKLLHDKAKETSRHAALAELQGDLATAEVGYENAMWLLMSLLDDAMYDVGGIKEDDRVSLEKVINPIRTRLEALRRKMVESPLEGGKT